MSWENNPRLNIEQLRQISEGDHEFEDDLLESYKSELEELLRQLKPLLEAGTDHESCVRLAHDVKGSSANVGAEGVRGVGKKMEDLAREGRYKDVLALLPEAKEEFNHLCRLWDDYKTTW